MDRTNSSPQKNKQPAFLQLSNHHEVSLRRQKSISIPASETSPLYISKGTSTPLPLRHSFYSQASNNSPTSIDYDPVRSRNNSADQGMHFLQVNSPTRPGLPHQLSGESTESASSYLSATSHDLTNRDKLVRSTSENSTTSSALLNASKIGLWPSFKKIIKDKKTPTFTKRKAEVRESYTDPVYHLLKCGANPKHNKDICQCDCHQKSDQPNEGL